MDAEEFRDAVWVGDLAAVEAMIAAGADVNAADAEGRSPALHLAIEQQWVEVVRVLVAAGVDVNRDQGQGWTPLTHAIDIESDAASQAGRMANQAATELTALLLSAGAVPTGRAYEVARAYRNYRALALLETADDPARRAAEAERTRAMDAFVRYDIELIAEANPPGTMGRLREGLRAWIVERGLDYSMGPLGGDRHCDGHIGPRPPATEADRQAFAGWLRLQAVAATVRLGPIEGPELPDIAGPVTDWVFAVDNLTAAERAEAAAYRAERRRRVEELRKRDRRE